MSDAGLWICSTSRDSFSGYTTTYSSRAQAILHAAEDLDLAPGDVFFTGQVWEPIIQLNVDVVLDDAQECLHEQIGGDHSGWPNCDDKQRDDLENKLNDVFNKWLETCGLRSDCFTVESVQAHIVPGRAVGDAA